MLPPSYLDRMPDAFVQLWQQVEDDILRDVARRIGKMDKVTATANWQRWRYQQTEAVRSDVVKLLAKYTGKSKTAIRKLLLQAATEAMEREDAIYYHYDMEPTPFEESAALNNLLDTTNTKQVDTLKNSFCSGYAKSDVEHMMVITKDGEVHYMTDNNPRGVDCSYLGGKLKGSYNIHTHPPKTTQYSFSTDADIPGAFADGTAVMEAVDYKYRYRFVVPENITFEQWESVCEEVREERNAVMESRGYGFDDYEENIQHVIIDETCRRLGLKCYHREKRT